MLVGQAACLCTESLDLGEFLSPGVATSAPVAYLTYSVYPSTWVKGSFSCPIAHWRGPGCPVWGPMDSTTRLPAEPLCIVGPELLSFLGDWKSLLWFCWTGPGDCFPSKAIGGTSVGSFAKIPRQKIQGSKAISIQSPVSFP